MAEINILSTFRAIEDAINRKEPKRALVILQHACHVIAADAPIQGQPQLKERMLSQLDATREALEGVDSLARVCGLALRAQSDDECNDVAVALHSIGGKVRNAQACLNDAMHMLPELSRLERVAMQVQS